MRAQRFGLTLRIDASDWNPETWAIVDGRVEIVTPGAPTIDKGPVPSLDAQSTVPSGNGQSACEGIVSVDADADVKQRHLSTSENFGE